MAYVTLRRININEWPDAKLFIEADAKPIFVSMDGGDTTLPEIDVHFLVAGPASNDVERDFFVIRDGKPITIDEGYAMVHVGSIVHDEYGALHVFEIVRKEAARANAI